MNLWYIYGRLVDLEFREELAYLLIRSAGVICKPNAVLSTRNTGIENVEDEK